MATTTIILSANQQWSPTTAFPFAWPIPRAPTFPNPAAGSDRNFCLGQLGKGTFSSNGDGNGNFSARLAAPTLAACRPNRCRAITDTTRRKRCKRQRKGRYWSCFHSQVNKIHRHDADNPHAVGKRFGRHASPWTHLAHGANDLGSSIYSVH